MTESENEEEATPLTPTRDYHCDVDDHEASSNVEENLQQRFEIESSAPEKALRSRECGVRFLATVLIAASMLGLIFFIYQDTASFSAASSFFQHGVADEVQEMPNEAYFSDDEIRRMQQQLSPKELIKVGKFGMRLGPHQFLHLHHMKTGGTSMDTLIRCAKSRLEKMGYEVPYGSLHECSPSMYARCLNGKDKRCMDRMEAASVISFCAPLRDLPSFSWDPTVQDGANTTIAVAAQHDAKSSPSGLHPIHAITVLRHPVERVWSMYRYKAKFCYNCRPLKDVYESIESGAYKHELGMNPENCAGQLQNHMTRNLIQHEMDGDVEDVVRQAIEDVKSFFTIVGLTDDLNATREMAGMVFPWLAEEVKGSDVKCKLTHANKSPENNRCGPNNSHWALPAHPSHEDAELIRKHNQLDLQLYHAAERHHQLQKVALGLASNKPR